MPIVAVAAAAAIAIAMPDGLVLGMVVMGCVYPLPQICREL